MLNLTRKVPKKGKSHSTYGDRNELVITTGSGEVISIRLVALKGNEVRIGIDAPKTMTIIRKEELTGNRGVEYEKRKAQIEEKGDL